MNALVDQILQSPSLPEIAEVIQERLAEERARRQRFYEEISEDKKAEFINGEVIIHSPARMRHLMVKEHLHRLVGLYVQIHQLGWVAGEKALCQFPRNDYEPDVCFFGREKAVRLTPQMMHFPIPDFIGEVLSESTEKTDRGQKFRDYQAHGVGEYWIIDPDGECLEQYLLQGGTYQLALKSGTGEVSSVIVSGFCVPIRALFDPAQNLARLREMLMGAA